MRGVLCRASNVFRQLRFASQLSIFPQVRPEGLLSGLQGLRGELTGTSLTCSHELSPPSPVLYGAHCNTDSHSSLGNQVLGDRQKMHFTLRRRDKETVRPGKVGMRITRGGRQGKHDLNQCCITAGPLSENGMEKLYFLSGFFLPVVEKVGVCRREGGIGSAAALA